jgi:protein-disulfide isomerase
MIHTPMGHATTALEPLDDAIDHVRGGAARHVILEYVDYERPYSRLADREIQRVERRLGGGVRFGFRHFPLSEIHPHALAAAAAAEAATVQGRFWEMHSLRFRHPSALASDDPRRYAAELGLDLAQFDRASAAMMRRIGRDIESGLAPGEARATPTLFIDGVVHRGGYDAPTLLEALAR